MHSGDIVVWIESPSFVLGAGDGMTLNAGGTAVDKRTGVAASALEEL